MTRGQDVVAAFVRKHPEELKSQPIRQELADYISIALTEAFELGERTMIKQIISKLEKEVQF